MLINKTQYGFISGRFILDGISAVQGLILAWIRQKKRKKKQCGAVLKLDFAKVYDMLDWSFIFEILHARGFDRRWINWIKIFLKVDKSQFW